MGTGVVEDAVEAYSKSKYEKRERIWGKRSRQMDKTIKLTAIESTLAANSG
jgi:hypothetical protein